MDKDDIKENIDATKNKTREKYADLKKMTMEKREIAKRYIRDNPERAIVTAAGIGMIVGLIVGCAVSGKRNWTYKNQ